MGTRMVEEHGVIKAGSRSSKKAYVVLVGLTGGGKSSTLNKIFDLAEKGPRRNDFHSATSTILEYSIKAPHNTKKDEECEMIICDTPGFGDTEGPTFQRDSQFMATLESYLDEHPELSKAYPTAVLLVVKFNDERIIAEKSSFIRMLKAMDSMISNGKLIDTDPKTCNLVIILTHTMSEQNVELQKDPTPKIRLIQSLIKNFTRIPSAEYVVMAENKPELYPELPQNKDYCDLPNGHRYPDNLFKTWKNLAKSCNDKVGEEVVWTIFKCTTELQTFLRKDIQLLHKEHSHVKKFYHQLLHGSFIPPKTKITKDLLDSWEEIDEDVRKPFASSIFLAAKVFHGLGIESRDDIPTLRADTVNLLAELPLNPPLESVIRRIGIVPPNFDSENATLGVGCFYNVLKDAGSNDSPYDFSSQKVSRIGFVMPTCVHAKFCKETEIIADAFVSQEECWKMRLARLGIVGEFPKCNPPKNGVQKIGYNVTTMDSKSEDRLTGVVEFREFKLSVGKNGQLSQDYEARFDKLPKEYRSRDKDKWDSFLSSTGTHIIKSTYIGGSMEVVATRMPNKVRIVSSGDVLAVIRNILKKAGETTKIDDSFKPQYWTIQINFHGGDPNLVKPTTLEHLFSEQGVQLWNKWVSSIRFHPVLLRSELKLESIVWHLMEKNVEPIANAISKSIGSINGKSKSNKCPVM